MNRLPIKELPWLSATGPYSTIVISSRVRIARNLKAFKFDAKLTDKEAENLLALIADVLKTSTEGEYFDFSLLNPIEIQSLLESHLISPDFATSKKKRGLFLLKSGNCAIMINEEDHLRIQALVSGFDFEGSFEVANRIEELLDSQLELAFDETFGYLTSCPTNVGTGLRVSAFLHLPGLVLTKEIEKVLRGAMTIGLAVRGVFGEGSDIRGNLFQISNQITLGSSEAEIIETLKRPTEQIIQYELKARDSLSKHAPIELEDKIFRALAILKSARLLTSIEATNLLSAVRLGVEMGLIKDYSLALINRLMILLRPANLQLYLGRSLTPNDRDIERAKLFQRMLRDGG
ncbi:protein arginine kinase [candidate division WOR-3 bacterium]|uniref:Protein-arginine kinase n=1 Tax=candidate division WOR-3 bacterium TaxID=2052148 RepID=A0A660SII2_UNCW3|nr:MAG: protein arginine kinase [candidate division WOR-3 bacterium]